jgi:hypothetical protein
MTHGFRLSPRARKAVLTVHIIASVALLGDVACFCVLAVVGATTDDPQLAASTWTLLETFSLVFGIPLSFTSLGSGLLLGWGTRWGVVRHRWVTTKLVLNVSVILVGALVLGPSTAVMQTGAGGRETTLIVASGYDVLALSLAVGLSVFRPRLRPAAAT